MTWPERFLEFFREIASPLSTVLSANGCREGWIQGEFYRRFKTAERDFSVNYSYPGNRAKHDLWCSQPTEMIAEIKAYGCPASAPNARADLKKIKRSLPAGADGTVVLALAEIQQLSPKKGSFFGDVLRLSESPQSIERFMILVLQKESDKIDDFGRAILAVRLSPNEHVFEYDGFLVRISQI